MSEASPALMGLKELAGRANARAERARGKGALTAAMEQAKFKPGERRTGRQKGTPNKVTQTIREAIEIAANECHPHGFAGWLVDRARGGIEDRKIFAGVVSRVVPLQVNAKSEGVVRIELGWLNGRDVGRHLSQSPGERTQVIDITAEPASSPLIKDQSADAQAPDAQAAGQAGEQE